ncbi:MAG: DNA cytosine methyltransferase [Candidatus Nanopelagicales bacterium]|nr:DNA cytosine methyltransferase [Candidatus Nanopelagicales bacterium]MCF8536440.1 DNA cytosine methyltransferase [Candidatus Nanopelagicales bacterium]MCF8558123.1 DNA cytosine methyltransferase [Candidatus Nanopelagicales bacterium]
MGSSTPEFRFIDLFAGIGGFHHALGSPAFGGECVLAVDIDADCRRVYSETWPSMSKGAIRGDIRELTQFPDGRDRPDEELAQLVPDHDVLCAGFPCQPFSKSGAQLGILDSTRGTLFFDIMKIVQAKKPKFLILENVRNLAGPRHVDTWHTIVTALRASGYRVADSPVVFSPHLLPPALGGRPQSRDRVFILAARVEDGDLTSDPLVERGPLDNWNPNDWNVEDYLQNDHEIEDIDRYLLRRHEIAWLDAWQAFIRGIPDDDLPGFPIWVDAFQPKPDIPAGTPDWKADFLRKNSDFFNRHRTFIRAWLRKSWIQGEGYRVADFPASRRKFEWQARSAQPTAEDRDIWQLTIHMRPSGIRVKPATYLPALVAITQTSIIGSRRRRITPIEAGRLQGLPDWVFPQAGVDDATAYRQVGNGVNVGVAQHVARALFASVGLSWGVLPLDEAEAAA